MGLLKTLLKSPFLLLTIRIAVQADVLGFGFSLVVLLRKMVLGPIPFGTSHPAPQPIRLSLQPASDFVTEAVQHDAIATTDAGRTRLACDDDDEKTQVIGS
jgi:hypothetical protein